MSIGTLTTAKHLDQYYSGTRRRAPNGFRHIGEGCYRIAILEKSTGVVYKVGDYGSNVAEALNARRLRRKSTRSLGFQLRVPLSRTYLVNQDNRVIAQEYAKGGKNTYCSLQDGTWMKDAKCNCSNKSPICFSTVHDRIRDFSGLFDIHSENVLIDKLGVFWLIDMGEGS